MWHWEKEFDSLEKLTKFLKLIERLDRAEIKNIGHDKWLLFFNKKR